MGDGWVGRRGGKVRSQEGILEGDLWDWLLTGGSFPFPGGFSSIFNDFCQPKGLWALLLLALVGVGLGFLGDAFGRLGIRLIPFVTTSSWWALLLLDPTWMGLHWMIANTRFLTTLWSANRSSSGCLAR